ncbi:hypothetical protein [Ralstonia phage RP31]|uniref:DUF3307 domain-containing protein n=2 Tax=Ripduovirus RP12 TaxID=2560700 RepID=A0A1L7N193_9CAUD|nr:membrane protein [Ralstonia phage RP12]BAW19236.1 hypothetical protein [Ralstonia phage RP12]BAW19522.1 hypothetical protein [Ralstonia phage RP31]
MFSFLHFTFPVLLFILIAGHCFGDFVFQGDFMAKTKNHKLEPDPCFWVPVLLAHCMVHALLVLLITGVFWTAIVMLVTHILIDFAKCQGWLGKGGLAFLADQLLHLFVVIMIAVQLTLL